MDRRESERMTDMELKSLRMELQRLSALVDGWSEAEEFPQLERDLALEKLRSIYEVLRFETPAADAETAASAPVASIDLGEVLSLDGSFVVRQDADYEPDAAEAQPVAGAFADTPAAEQPEERPSDSGAASDGAACDSSGPVADAGHVVAAGEHATQVGTRSSEQPESGPETLNPAEAAPTAETSAVASTTEADAVVSATVSQPEASAESAPASAPSSATGAATGSTYVTPTLFGPEEATVRHRYKQRVIMSLYGDDRQTSRQPAAAEASSSEARKQETPSSPASEEIRKPERTGNLPVEPASDVPNGAETAERHVSGPTPAEALAPESLHAEIHQAETLATEPVPAVAPDAASADCPVPEVPIKENTETSAASTDSQATVAEPAEASVRSETESGGTKSGQTTAAGAVLGEVINHDVQTLADTLAAPRDAASELRRSEPVTHLGRAIGINDKFLLIRDLFDGDAAAYETAIETLDGFTDLDQCLIHIAENYVWNADSDGARLLMDLLERKFA